MSALSDLTNVELVVIDEGGTPPIESERGMTDEEAYAFLTGQSLTAASDPLEGLPNVEPSLDEGDAAKLLGISDEETSSEGESDQQEANVNVPYLDDTGEHTGAMIALVPRSADIERLVIEGGEPREQLHLTLLYLGDAVNWSATQRQMLTTAIGDVAALESAVEADGFGAALWNPTGDSPAVVLNVGGEVLETVHRVIGETVAMVWDTEIPEQHTPWVPHVCLAYSSDAGLVTQALERVGPVVFDRIRVAWGPDIIDLPLYDTDVAVTASAGTEVEVTHMEDTAASASTGTVGVPGSWEGILVVEDIETGDGRQFSSGSLEWAEPWLPLAYAKENLGEHLGSVTVARIDQIWRDESNPAIIRAKGVFDLASPEGQDAYGAVQRGFQRGVSVDVDSVKDADVELVFPQSSDDNVGDELMDLFATPEKTIFHRGRIRGATLVSLPAFVEAQIWLTDGTMSVDTASAAATGQGSDTGYALDILAHACSDGATALAVAAARLLTDASLSVSMAQRRAAYAHLGEHMRAVGLTPQPFEETSFSDEVRALVAGSATITERSAPPAAWFTDPHLPLPSPITVTDDGRVFGHAAVWGTCHTSFADACVTPPREGDHVYYRLGEIVTAEGTRVAVGGITLGTGHAPTFGIDPRRAVEHYDNTGTCVADVVSGEDDFGIWVAGALRPGLTAARIRELRGAKLSGDWRRIGGQLRLVALLAVNVPGFGVPRLRTEMSGGRQMSLVAAGIVPHGTSSDRDIFRQLADGVARRIGRDRESRVAALRARVHRTEGIRDV